MLRGLLVLLSSGEGSVCLRVSLGSSFVSFSDGIRGTGLFVFRRVSIE